MALTVQQLEAMRDKLQTAIFSGQMKVKFGDREVTYQTTADMERALDRLQRQIADTSGKSRRRRTYLDSRKGFG